MQFYDEVKITIASGRGGDGIVSARREAGVPYGGPAGGDGGRGGDIVFIASKDENTLLAYKYKKKFKAKQGESGQSKERYGANGPHLKLKVPVGTLIKDTKTGEILYSFTRDKEKWTTLEGGEGGKGNIHFKSPTRQFPNFALLGEPEHKQEITLELQLLGDVALIGNPSVGKTSIINLVSHTKAKIGEYHFTTIIPNLGSVKNNGVHFNIIDIPGLIKGASKGKGLGNHFLRHIIKSSIFCFITDMNRFEKGISESLNLLSEIISFAKEKFQQSEVSFAIKDSFIHIYVKNNEKTFLDKKILFLINKYDLINDPEISDEYIKKLLEELNIFLEQYAVKISPKIFKKNALIISAATGHNIQYWLNTCSEIVSKNINTEISRDKINVQKTIEEKTITNISKKEKEKLIEKGYIDPISSKYSQIRLVKNRQVSKLTQILPRGNDEAEMRFWGQLQDIGFITNMDKSGIQKGDILKIKSYYEGKNDKYILY